MPKAVSRLEVLQVCKLLQCVRAKDKQQVEKLTTSGIPHLINYNDADEGNTALSVAAIANDDEMIEFLLELGAHPDVMDLKGRTAAMRAAEFGHVHCLEKLLAAGANMTLVDLEGKGIIFYCIANTERHAKCLELALQHGAMVNNTAKDGTPVFLLACETALENEEMCLTLLEKGADPNSKIEKSGRTALMAAANSGSAKVVKAILNKGGNVNMVDARKNHAAHFAAKGGHLECLMCMGGFSAQFDQNNMDGNNPVHLAAMGGHAMACKYLSQRGCNPKPKNNEGNTARTIAKDDGHKDAMKELRKAEKTFGKVGKNNEPWALALYDWVVQSQDRILKLLKEFDPDDMGTVSKDDFCDTISGIQAPVEEDELRKLAALHDKAREGKVDYNDFMAAKKWINKNYLMSAFEGKKKKKKKGKKGGKKKGKFKLVMPICTQDEGPRTFGGAPPQLYIPRHIHFTDTARFDRDSPPKHPLQDDSAWYLQHPERSYVNINEAAKLGDFDSLKMALQKNVPIDTRDRYYKTALMTAAGAGHFEMVKYLVEQGASINLRDNFKWTALHHACHSGQLDVVQLLVENGGEIDAATMNGGTPLTRAIESSREQVVQYLINHGAKMQTENKKGMSPMDIAQAWADPRVLEIVQRKWETLPSLDKKKGGKGGKGGKASGGGKGKRPASAPGDKEGEKQVGTTAKPSTLEEMPPLHRKGSILRAASALAGGAEEREDITYTPLRAWTKQPTTQELIQDKETKRERFGWEVDFADFQMPFQKNVANKLVGMDDDD
ncbi:ankyrin repeat and EF-hand domain-containing protein 1-like isoform X2 [Babylonia areolata]|uniref:ankyrin repeat and EF-hand domain-containing protein 1-like isoform X2 n=1 Tax=Babylonia areolata TaxID=304850 RepID=UPI003FD454DA